MSPLIITHKQTQQPNARQHPFSRQFPVSMQILFSPVKLGCISLTCQYNMGFWIQNIESGWGERERPKQWQGPTSMLTEYGMFGSLTERSLDPC